MVLPDADHGGTNDNNNTATAVALPFALPEPVGNLAFTRLRDLEEFLDYLDSSNMEWHIKRGLPKTYLKRRDLVALTARHREDEVVPEAKSTTLPAQELHELGTRRDGYGLIYYDTT